MTLAYNIANDPELRKAFKIGGVRLTLKMLSKFDTVDARHLKRRLASEDPLTEITAGARHLVSREGTLTPYTKVNPVRIKAELEMLLSPQVRPTDVRSWVRENMNELDKLSTLRLDWLWDFSWCYFIHPAKFGKKEFLVYGALRGIPPAPAKNIPYQSALNNLRKNRRDRRDRKLYKLARDGDEEGLMEMGFTSLVAQQAIDKVARGSG
ncbi:hypothetical protein LCGC14_0381530 [marine sediment metagenome]|uniref:Uncharacterized protein n=1 Tax=marine sediment metagenome TaxID=412755 RepID=A0A0F9VPC2_9ZZZZ